MSRDGDGEHERVMDYMGGLSGGEGDRQRVEGKAGHKVEVKTQNMIYMPESATVRPVTL